MGDRQAIEVIDPNIVVVGGAVIHHNQWLIDWVIENKREH
jgi:glucokinase